MKYILNNGEGFEIVGKQYLEGIGGYYGTNPDSSKDVSEVLNGFYTTPPNNEIWYTSTTGSKIDISFAAVSGNIVSETYKNGKGVVKFDGEIQEIGYTAFAGCLTLESIVIPDSVYLIDAKSFQGCTGLKSVIVGNGVTRISEYAFQYCSNLENVIIGNRVATIAEGAFYNCSSLASITIPDSVNSISHRAFYGCSNLIKVYFRPTTPPNGGGLEFFYGCHNDMKIYVPIDSLDAYNNMSWISSYKEAFVGCVFEDEHIIDISSDDIERIISDYFQLNFMGSGSGSGADGISEALVDEVESSETTE
jgi:hypothetical protein